MVITDLPERVEVAAQTATSCAESTSFAPLTWGSTDDAAALLQSRGGEQFDLILASEVLHWPALDMFSEDTRAQLVATCRELCRPGGRLVLGYKERKTHTS